MAGLTFEQLEILAFMFYIDYQHHDVPLGHYARKIGLDEFSLAALVVTRLRAPKGRLIDVSETMRRYGIDPEAFEDVPEPRGTPKRERRRRRS